jgi:hypothetical protein
VSKNPFMVRQATTNGTAQYKFKYLAVRPEQRVEGRSAISSHDHGRRGAISESLR